MPGSTGTLRLVAGVVDFVGVPDGVREPAGGGIDMHRSVEHSRVVPEDGLRTVAVVGVDVDDRDAFEPGRAQLGGRNGRVVEVAATAEEGRPGVMTGRAADRIRHTRSIGHQVGRSCRRVG